MGVYPRHVMSSCSERRVQYYHLLLSVTHTENEFFLKFSYTLFGCELELELEFNDLNGLKQH